ncbi:hypothetical protein BDV26DRAFT_23858 [Aspergillus bertholletiae]|uniref:Uncharacterized protein n=1 Tax=Aspergillus bertholletiae TaxID=1226010 RepID=A0A5N7B1S9_9EURO|nr:hypothetical protein BDV26DRAFT_23858 [Aspergillus bertholletiae]
MAMIGFHSPCRATITAISGIESLPDRLSPDCPCLVHLFFLFLVFIFIFISLPFLHRFRFEPPEEMCWS